MKMTKEMGARGFGPGTLIDTTSGPVPIEWLSPSDALLTRSGAPRGRHKVYRVQTATPLVAVEPAAFGASPEQHSLVTTAAQSLLVEGGDVSLHFGFAQAFAELDDLYEHPSVSVVADPFDHLFVVVTDQPSVIRANGLWAESASTAVSSFPGYPRLHSWETELLMRERGQWESDRLYEVA